MPLKGVRYNMMTRIETIILKDSNGIYANIVKDNISLILMSTLIYNHIYMRLYKYCAIFSIMH